MWTATAGLEIMVAKTKVPFLQDVEPDNSAIPILFTNRSTLAHVKVRRYEN